MGWVSFHGKIMYKLLELHQAMHWLCHLMTLAIVWEFQLQNKDEEGTNSTGLKDVANEK